MKISLGADHGAVELREAIVQHLTTQGHEVIDHGTYTHESVDYPDFAFLVGEDIVQKRAELGVLCCTTGIGMCISANKMAGVRAAIVHHVDEAALTRRHNNANVICFGQLHTTKHEAALLLDAFINQQFEGGRHERRVNKFTAFEKTQQNPSCCQS